MDANFSNVQGEHIAWDLPTVLESIGYPTLPSCQHSRTQRNLGKSRALSLYWVFPRFPVLQRPQEHLDWDRTRLVPMVEKQPPWGGKSGEAKEPATRGKSGMEAEELCPCPAQ